MTEIGNRLKEARLEKGMSLDDLQEVTKIQKRYLQGIEEGNYKMMPGPFYVRAFIKQYAEAVNLEPEEIFEQYKSEIPATFNDDLPEKLSRVQTRRTIPGSSSKFFDVLPKILVIAFIIGALVVIWYFWSINANNDSNEPIESNNGGAIYEEAEGLNREEIEKEPEDEEPVDDGEDENENEEETEETVIPQELVSVETNGSNSTFELKNAEQFMLKVVSTGETWIELKNGKGYSYFQGILKKGANENHIQDFSNETEVVIRIGNSTNTEIYVNDEKLEFTNTSITQNITILFSKVSQ